MKKSTAEIPKSVIPPEISSSDVSTITQTATLNLALEETGSFRICTPANSAKQTANVLRRLNDRERELWSRRFTTSCVDNILSSDSVDKDTKDFYAAIAKKLREQ